MGKYDLTGSWWDILGVVGCYLSLFVTGFYFNLLQLILEMQELAQDVYSTQQNFPLFYAFPWIAFIIRELLNTASGKQERIQIIKSWNESSGVLVHKEQIGFYQRKISYFFCLSQ